MYRWKTVRRLSVLGSSQQGKLHWFLPFVVRIWWWTVCLWSYNVVYYFNIAAVFMAVGAHLDIQASVHVEISVNYKQEVTQGHWKYGTLWQNADLPTDLTPNKSLAVLMLMAIWYLSNSRVSEEDLNVMLQQIQQCQLPNSAP